MSFFTFMGSSCYLCQRRIRINEFPIVLEAILDPIQQDQLTPGFESQSISALNQLISRIKS